jgi:hypothetical protein
MGYILEYNTFNNREYLKKINPLRLNTKEEIDLFFKIIENVGGDVSQTTTYGYNIYLYQEHKDIVEHWEKTYDFYMEKERVTNPEHELYGQIFYVYNFFRDPQKRTDVYKMYKKIHENILNKYNNDEPITKDDIKFTIKAIENILLELYTKIPSEFQDVMEDFKDIVWEYGMFNDFGFHKGKFGIEFYLIDEEENEISIWKTLEDLHWRDVIYLYSLIMSNKNIISTLNLDLYKKINNN